MNPLCNALFCVSIALAINFPISAKAKIRICDIHKKKMTPRTVPIVYGVIDLRPELYADSYYQAEKRLFPHHTVYQTGGCEPILPSSPTSTKLYFCSECDKAREAWLSIHTEALPLGGYHNLTAVEKNELDEMHKSQNIKTTK